MLIKKHIKNHKNISENMGVFQITFKAKLFTFIGFLVIYYHLQELIQYQ